jgi:electron transfer flavoprotein alpha subunit
MSADVFVVVEHQGGTVEDITFELLGKGRALASSTGGNLVGVLMGSGTDALAESLGAADQLLVVDHEALAHFNPATHGTALAAVVTDRNPQIVLVANTSMGMDLAAALSVDADLPLVAYATEVEAGSDGVRVTSQLYAGKMNVESLVAGGRCVVSLIAGAGDAAAGQADGAPSVESFPAPDALDASGVRFVRLIEPEGGDVDITQSEILVSIGRGIQSDENIPMAQELADALGGALSASRPIIDSKWLPKTRQVGKSGVKVKPKLYLALGISGAPEHWEGMKDSELIIAVNTDANAPIFDFAHYGVTEDLFDVLPALMERLG